MTHTHTTKTTTTPITAEARMPTTIPVTPNAQIQTPSRRVNLADIHVFSRMRPLNQAIVSELVESIRKNGLRHPITITRENRLIDGNHRLEALKRLGIVTIECDVEKSNNPLIWDLMEIELNLIRSKLHYTELGDHLLRKKEIYEELYPKTKRGAVNQYTKMQIRNISDSITSFVNDTARKMGVSEATIRNVIQISKNFSPEIKKAVKEQDIPKGDALKLARLSKDDQIEVMKRIKLRPQNTLKDAIRGLELEKRHIDYLQEVNCTSQDIICPIISSDDYYDHITVEISDEAYLERPMEEWRQEEKELFKRDYEQLRWEQVDHYHKILDDRYQRIEERVILARLIADGSYTHREIQFIVETGMQLAQSIRTIIKVQLDKLLKI